MIKIAAPLALALAVLLVPAATLAATPNRIIVLATTDGDNSMAVSADPFLPQYANFLTQIGAESQVVDARIGGERFMALLADGTVYTKDHANANWITQTTGAQAIAIGSNGDMMIINSAGNAYSKVGGLYSPWVQQTGNGASQAIAVNGNRLMVIDSADNAYSKDSTYDSWTLQVTGARDVVLGPNGQMGVINSIGNTYTKAGRTAAWEQQTNNGVTQLLAIGGGGRMMVLDGANDAYSKESATAPWVHQVDGAVAVAVGTSGRMMVIDSDLGMHYKDNPAQGWAPVSLPGIPHKYPYWVSIN